MFNDCVNFKPHNWEVDHVDVKFTDNSFEKNIFWRCAVCRKPMEEVRR